MTKHVIELVYEKSTPNTHRYKEVEVEGEKLKIKQLYVQKTALPNRPERIKVTIEAMD